MIEGPMAVGADVLAGPTEAGAGDGEELAAALDRVAAAAEDGVRLQAQVGAAARTAAGQERARAGAGGPRVREVLDLLTAHTDRLTGAAGELRRAWAGALAETGSSIREIATRLGVSHQRVSVLLRRGGTAGRSAARP